MLRLEYSPPSPGSLALTRTMHFTAWIYHSLPCLLLLISLLLQPSPCSADVSNEVLTSTPYSITLSFEPHPGATNYTASFSQSNSPFFNYFNLEPPFNSTTGRLNFTYDAAYPGLNYTVILYENDTTVADMVFDQQIATVPLAPMNVRAPEKETTYLVVTWDSYQNISYSSHRIYFRQSNESQYQTREGTSDQSYTLQGLRSGYVYDVYVTAIAFDYQEDKESASSMLFSSATLPAPPTNLTAEAENTTHITVTWIPQASSFQDSFEVTYLVQGTNSTAPCQESPCSIVPGPPAGQEVVVYVSAVSHGVASIAEQIRTSTEPDPVADLKAIEGVRSLDLSWKVPSNAAITSFHIRVVNIQDNSTREFTKEAASGETLVTYPLTTLLGGSVYQVFVAAETLYARGDPKTDVFRTIPEPVSGLEGVPINTTAFQLSWKNPRHTVMDQVIIVITKPDGSTLELEESKETQNKEVVQLVPGETYHVSVFIHTPLTPKVSEASNVTITIKPIKPKLLSSTSREKSLSIVLAQEEEIGVFSSIQASIDSGPMQNASVDGQIDFDTLTPGTEYSLEAVTMSGQEKSEVFALTLYTKPRPAQNLDIEVLNSTSIRVVWDAPDEGGYDKFVVSVVEAEGGSQQLKQTTPDLEVDFTDVMAGTTYNVSVVTVKGDQESVALQDQNTTAPLGVTDIRLSVRGINSVTLTWDPPVRSHLEGYALTFDLTNVTLLELPGTDTQYKLEGLEPDTNYTIQIFTFALRPGDGVKLYSSPRRFNFSTYPESVAALQKVDATENSITVNWTDPAVGDFNFYNLGVKEEISGRESRPLLLPRSTTNYTYEGLIPGKVYLVAIRTVLRLQSGRQRYGILVRLSAVTKPLPVDTLQVSTVSTTALLVNWSTNDTSSQDKFLISYEAEGTIKTTEVLASNNSLEYQLSLSQLLSGSSYTVQVVAIRSILTDSEDSLPTVVEGYTKPNPASNLTLVKEDDNSVTITWTAPTVGGVDDYRIRYRSVLRDPTAEFQMSTSALTSKRLVDLFPGEKYEVTVVAVRHDLESEEINATIVLKPLAPVSFVQTKEKTTTDSVTVGWSYSNDSYYSQKWIISYTDGGSNTDIEETTRASGDYSVFITGLKAGETYSVSIRSQVLNLTSDVQMLMVTAKPVVNTDIAEVSTTNESITFAYTIKDSDIFDQFVFSVDPKHSDPVYRLKNETLTTASLFGLNAGTQYMLYAFTLSKSELSSGFISMEFITDPNPVSVTLDFQARQITLRFGAQLGGAAEYVISCIQDCGNKTVPSGTGDVTFANLRPFSTYSFAVVTRTIEVGGKVKEVSREYEGTTLQAAPTEVLSLSVVSVSIHSVRLLWQKPKELNGILQGYIVSYRGVETNVPNAAVHENIFTLSSMDTSIELQGLYAGYTYIFQVFAQTVADGKPSEKSLTLKTASPTFKSNITPESSKPTEPDAGKEVTQKSISLKFTNPFSSDAGYVRYYSVIVSRNPDADDSSPTLPTWDEAKKDKSIVVYEAVTRCGDFFTTDSLCGAGSSRKRRAAANDMTTRTFVVGDQTEAECQGQQSCNGPLKEGTAYYIKLRGFTQSGQFSDTAYSEKIKTGEKSSSSSGGIIGGVVGTLVGVGVCMAVVIVVVLRRKRCPKKATKHVGPKASWEQSTMNKFSRPVKLLYFPEHVRKMAADSDFKYAEEYEDLKEVGRDQPTLAAEFPPNRPKNRFTNILPYDHSRVKLLPTDDEEGSDYINANYMPGYNSKREYIATQGPLPATRDDFWRMLWEQCSRNIVMLTRCQEKGREKSDHYWPSDSEPKFYGDLQVVILNETHMPDWTIVEFRVSHGEQSRQVRHFHYRVWPDFGVPKDPASLIRFVRTVREKLIREGGPIILHCSAGVGRSGTFIVLDHLLQLIREKDEVDIFSVVYKLRKERVLMVQTEQQYKFIHECLLCVLENREHDTTYANLGQINVGFEDDEGINLEGS